MSISAPSDIIPIIVIATAILAGIMYMIRSQIAMQKQFHPNGGSSFKDQMNRIEADMRDVRSKVDDHIQWHLED